MRTAGSAFSLVVVAFVTSTQPARSAVSSTDLSRELRNKAADYAYNLDHGDAIRLLRDAVARDPDNPASHRALASSLWLDILYRRGAVTVDHYLGSFTRTTVDMKNPPAELDAEFKREVSRAVTLARRRVAAAPTDPQAHYDLGTALGLEASYTASVEGKLLAGFRAARGSYDEEERVLALDPARKEAGLIVGSYRYLVSTLSLPMRVVAYVAGFGGGKERGLRMVEEAAAANAENRTDAQFALVLLYNREKRYADALRVLEALRLRYPRNRLVLLEEGSTAIRANQPAQAETTLNEGLEMFAKDPRPKIPGEGALWHYKRGAARVLLNRRDGALADLNAALGPDAAGWVQGRAHVELGRLALQRGDRETARREAAAGSEICRRNNDELCVEMARRLTK